MRRLIVALGTAGLIGAIAAPAMVACKSIPSKTCFGDRVNALEAEDASTSDDCTRCLQTKCCDDVGRCQDDPACRDPFRAAHACVVDGGGAEESRCTTDLPASSRTLYTCARQNCGPACTIPSCDLTASAVLFENASCDKCIGGACCTAINQCYGNRSCKLVLECILKECNATLGNEMTTLSTLGRDGIETQRVSICNGETPPAGGEAVLGACIGHCLDEFVKSPGTTDDRTARCLAFGVYACGASNECGTKCSGLDVPFDAGISDAN